MKLTLYIIITMFSIATRAQTVEDPVPDLQLEELAEWHETEPEDESFQQQLERFHDKPLNLNDPNIGDADFPLLSPLLLHNLLEYRRSLGDLVAIHELQAVPGFTVSLIKKLLPFIYVEAVVSRNILSNVSQSSQQMIVRPSAMGKTYVRYKYIAADDLQFGGLAERDAGERSYFDFTSFHLFMRGKRLLTTAAFGDYSLNIESASLEGYPHSLIDPSRQFMKRLIYCPRKNAKRREKRKIPARHSTRTLLQTGKSSIPFALWTGCRPTPVQSNSGKAAREITIPRPRQSNQTTPIHPRGCRSKRWLRLPIASMQIHGFACLTSRIIIITHSSPFM